MTSVKIGQIDENCASVALQ